MVIMLRIGQSAGLLTNSIMIGYVRVSTTERVLVNIDGLINLSLLKIQSSPLGKPRGISEMNLHVPQSYSSAVELEELAAVPYQIVSPATNSALVQLVQDSLLGYYVITHDDILIDRRDMMNILMGVPSFNGILPEPAVEEDKRQYWTGKQLISIGMPRINLKFKGTVIENGHLLKGRITKSESNMIIQVIYNDFGPKVCQEYLDNIQNIVTRFLVKHGFSIGVSDLIISDDIRRKVQDIIVDGKKQVLEVEKKIHLNILTDIKKTVHETFEGKVIEIVNDVTKKIDSMYKKYLKEDNRAVMMKSAGSKGGDRNIRQMSTHLGQQIVQGKRVPIGYTDRTLPHYYRYDSDIISRGFVENSFMDGLTPQESFFHAMGGREGLIDTAVKSVTGDTPIVIIEDDEPKYVKIGDWIDDKLYENKKNVRYESKNSLELLDLDENVVIPTTDYDGNVSWGDVTCVTRHDPGKVLYQIKTKTGRSVIVTESKSLLIWIPKLNQFKEELTPKINVGDFVPAINELPKLPTHINVRKNPKLDLSGCDINKSTRKHNDVVLDQITEINEISPDDYPKMYDLTIPSTLNFGLANGLQVRDTSESGYIQRKLIKAMEDLKVYHDNTVRNANGDIVEFLYGCDGIDASGGIEGNRMELVTEEYAVLKEELHFSQNENWETFMSKSAIKKMKQSKDWKKQLDGYFKNLMDDRDKLFEIFDYTANANMEFLKAPFNAERIINNTIQIYKIRGDGLSDLSPIEVMEAVDDLCNHLTINEFPNFNFNLIVKSKFAPKAIIKKYRLTKLAFAHAINLLKMKFNDAIVQAGEMVGMLSAQSLGETSTQLTLNSVTGETKILINEDNTNKVVNIGEWIDTKMKNNRSEIKHIPRNRTQYLELKEKVMIPSCDMKGKTGWHELTAITKHLPVGDLVKITTHSGRTVTATQAKSFLTYDNKTKKLVRTNGSDIKVGDRVPITYKLNNDLDTTSHLDISQYLPKDKWLYGTDYNKAKKYYEKYVEERESVKEHNKGMKKKDKRRIRQTMNFAETFREGKMFTLPYNRYDTFYDTLTPKKLNSTTITEGYIYPKICSKVCSKIPEKIELNKDFGFIVGIYLAEGWATNTFVGISNNDKVIQQKVYDWCDSISTTHHTVVTESKRFKGAKSTDMKIHSVTLARLFKKWMNTGSSKKIVPAEAFTSPDEFVKGLLDGYISGDGTVSKKDGSVVVTSASEEMLMGISNLMNRFGIFGKLSRMEIKKNNVGSKNIKPVHSLRISNGFVQEFAEIVGSTHPNKDKRLNEITLQKDYKYAYGKNYRKLNNTMLDKIVNIEYIDNTDENGDMINVYDVTVPNTLNFTIFNCLNCDDTFHAAGSGATVTTKGVPRLRELLSNTKNMATPSSTLFLNEDARYTLEKALEVKYNIEITTIRDIVISCSIYNDPDNKFKSVVEEDRNILEIYKVFHEIDDNCREMNANPWVLRFKFDRSKMMERKISMDNIYQIVTQSYSNAICIYSDDNSNDLVFRIRLDFIASTEKSDDDVKLLKKVENKLLDLVVKGIDGIDGSHVSEHNINLVKDEVGNYTTKSERKLTTDGSNLIDLINIGNVDFTRCYSNDINEVYHLYGIEAARTVLFNEFSDIFNASSVNYRHIAMLCDIMTNQGIIMSIDRHGINRGTNGPLAKCSFEEAVDQLQKAAIHGDRDNVAGVSANIMMGQVPPSGTGDSTLILDELKLIETQEVEKLDDEIDIDEILNVSDYCQENVAINFNVNKIKKKKVNVKNIPKIKPE
jgi:DNA-directed RNA polymerase beta' subunit